MIRLSRSIPALALLSLAACVSPFQAEPAPSAGSAPETPGQPQVGDATTPPPVTGTPREDELTERFGVFVVEGGRENGDGTRAEPFGSIAKAIAKAKINKRRVYVCEGTYREALALEDGVSVIGGYTCAGEWRSGTRPSRVEAPTSPAIQARNIASVTRFEGFEVVAPAGTPAMRSSIGLVAERANGLTVARARIEARRGADGADGVTPPAAVHTGDPDGGESRLESDACAGLSLQACMQWNANPTPRAGAAGGDGTCSAGGNAEGGGRGQGANAYVFEVRAIALGARWYLYSEGSPNARETRAGLSGQDGASGASGAAGVFSAAGYTPGDGAPGASGSPGAGGSGGAADTTILGHQPAGGDKWFASTGGGGGAGGCAGLAGTAGTGGGASVAAIVVASSGLELSSVDLVAADGGRGGAGAIGAAPTLGGAWGGSPRAPVAERGGRGGLAGTSGGGAGGPSYALVAIGGAPKRAGGATQHGAGGVGAPALSETFVLPVPKGAGAVETFPREVTASPAGGSGDLLELAQ